MFKKSQSMYQKQKYQSDSSSSAYQSDYHDVTFMKLNKIQSEDERFVLNQTFQLSSDQQNQLKTFADDLNSMAHSNCSQVKNFHLSATQNNAKVQQITKKRRKTFSLMKDIQSKPTIHEKLKQLLNYNQNYSSQKYKILYNPKIQKQLTLESGQKIHSIMNPQVVTLLDYQTQAIISKIKFRQYKEFIQKIKKQSEVQIKVPNFALVKIQVDIQKIILKGFIGLQNGKNMKIQLQKYGSDQEEQRQTKKSQQHYFFVFDINQPTKNDSNGQKVKQNKDSPTHLQSFSHVKQIKKEVGIQSLKKYFFQPLMLYKNKKDQKQIQIQKQQFSYDYEETYLPQIKKYSPYRQMQLSPLKKNMQVKKLNPYLQNLQNSVIQNIDNRQLKSFKSKHEEQKQGDTINTEPISSYRQKQFLKQQMENRKSDLKKIHQKQIAYKKKNSRDKQQKLQKYSQLDSDQSQKQSSIQSYLNEKSTLRSNQKQKVSQNRIKLKNKKIKNKSDIDYEQVQREKEYRQRQNPHYRIKSNPKKYRRSSHQKINPRLTINTQQSEHSARKSYNSSQYSQPKQSKIKLKRNSQPKAQHIVSNAYNAKQLKQILLKSTKKSIKKATVTQNYSLKINNIALQMDKFQPSGKFIKMFIESKYKKKVIFGTQIVQMLSKQVIWSLNNCDFYEIGDYDMFHMEVFQILSEQTKDQQNTINFCDELIISCSELIYLTKSQDKNQQKSKLTLYNGCLVKDKKLVGNCLLSFSLSSQQKSQSTYGQSSTQTIPEANDQQLDQNEFDNKIISKQAAGYSRAKLNHVKKQVKFRKRLYSQQNISTSQKNNNKLSRQQSILEQYGDQEQQQQEEDSHNNIRLSNNSNSRKKNMRNNDSPVIRAMIDREEYMNSIDEEDDFNLQN